MVGGGGERGEGQGGGFVWGGRAVVLFGKWYISGVKM